jgi:hypothetical protein
MPSAVRLSFMSMSCSLLNIFFPVKQLPSEGLLYFWKKLKPREYSRCSRVYHDVMVATWVQCNHVCVEKYSHLQRTDDAA